MMMDNQQKIMIGWYVLKSFLSRSKSYLINSRVANHMVASKDSFTTLNLTKVPTIHLGDDSQIPAAGRGSIKIQHGDFKNVLYVPSLATNLLSV